MDVKHTKDSLQGEINFPNNGEEMELTIIRLKTQYTKETDKQDFPTEEEVVKPEETEDHKSNVAIVSDLDNLQGF